MRTRGATLIGAEAPSSSLRATHADRPLRVSVETPVTPTRAIARSDHGSRIHSALARRRAFTIPRLAGTTVAARTRSVHSHY